MSIGILGTGSYLPDRVVSNDALVKDVSGISADRIESKTAIRSRRFADAGDATSDLAARAAADALANAGLPVDRVDFLIVSTSTGDHPQPPTACLVQDLLGAHGAACFDINVVCAGFVHAVVLARALVAGRPGTHALVVGADLYSRILDFDDWRTAVLFGDGAGAAVVGPVPPARGVLDYELASRGDEHDLIWVAAGGSRRPASPQTVAEGGHHFRMKGRAVSDIVLQEVPPFVDKFLSRNGIPVADVDHVVAHQANGVLLDTLLDRCGLASTRDHRTVEEYGNVGSAGIPVTLDAAHRADRFADGDLVLLLGFGGGISMGACLLRWAA